MTIFGEDKIKKEEAWWWNENFFLKKNIMMQKQAASFKSFADVNCLMHKKSDKEFINEYATVGFPTKFPLI